MRVYTLSQFSTFVFLNMSAVEMRPPKSGHASVDSVSETKGNDSENEAKVAHAYGSTHTADTTSLRRLFGFVQLLAFALTFMESWEVMVMSMFDNVMLHTRT